MEQPLGEESAELLPGERPAPHAPAALGRSTQQVRLLRLLRCKAQTGPKPAPGREEQRLGPSSGARFAAGTAPRLGAACGDTRDPPAPSSYLCGLLGLSVKRGKQGYSHGGYRSPTPQSMQLLSVPSRRGQDTSPVHSHPQTHSHRILPPFPKPGGHHEVEQAQCSTASLHPALPARTDARRGPCPVLGVCYRPPGPSCPPFTRLLGSCSLDPFFIRARSSS